MAEVAARATAERFRVMKPSATVENTERLQGASVHATPCHGLRAGEQGHRHPDAASVPRPSLDPEHGQVHRTGAGPLQEPVAMTPTPVSAQR